MKVSELKKNLKKNGCSKNFLPEPQIQFFQKLELNNL